MVWRAIIVFCLHSWRFLVNHLLLCFILFFRKCVELLRLGERSAPWLTVLAFKLLSIIKILVRLHHAPNVRKRESSRDFRCCQSLSVGFNSWQCLLFDTYAWLSLVYESLTWSCLSSYVWSIIHRNVPISHHERSTDIRNRALPFLNLRCSYHLRGLPRHMIKDPSIHLLGVELVRTAKLNQLIYFYIIL